MLIEECLHCAEWNYLFSVIQVSVACSGNYHEDLVVIFAGSDCHILVGIASKI